MGMLVIRGEEKIVVLARSENGSAKYGVEAHLPDAPQMHRPRAQRTSQERMEVIDLGGKVLARSLHQRVRTALCRRHRNAAPLTKSECSPLQPSPIGGKSSRSGYFPLLRHAEFRISRRGLGLAFSAAATTSMQAVKMTVVSVRIVWRRRNRGCLRFDAFNEP